MFSCSLDKDTMPVIQPAEAVQEEEQGKPLDLTGGLGCALLGWNELTGGVWRGREWGCIWLDWDLGRSKDSASCRSKNQTKKKQKKTKTDTGGGG